MSTEQFYNDLVSYYDLIFPDWDASMTRQGDALARVIREGLRPSAGASPRVLDAAAGIGTQALPLAARGFRVTARDLSPQAIARLTDEAAARGLILDAGVADMRTVAATVTDHFEAVVCCDNSLPHLLTDTDIASAFSQFRAVLIEDGVCVCAPCVTTSALTTPARKATNTASVGVVSRCSGCGRNGAGSTQRTTT